MTRSEAKQIVYNFKCGAGLALLGAEVALCGSSERGDEKSPLCVHVRLRVPERDNKDQKDAPLEQMRILDPSVFATWTDYLFARWLRNQLLDVLQHELDESILIDGVRLFDPHRPIEASRLDWKSAREAQQLRVTMHTWGGSVYVPWSPPWMKP